MNVAITVYSNKFHAAAQGYISLQTSLTLETRHIAALKLRPPGGGGNFSFQDTGLCHSNRKVPRINPENFLKSIPINLENFLKIISINLEMPKLLTNK